MKLRVIAGELRGRRFDAPRGRATHPMGDRVRTALFNKLGPLSGQTVLDPFAGSGALSFEAVSRGAASAVAIERDRKAQDTLAANTSNLGLDDRVQVIKNGCRAWSHLHPSAEFQLILCDPPYDDINRTTLELLSRHLAVDGRLVLSQPGSEQPLVLAGLMAYDTSRYAWAQLVFYRRA